MITLNFNCLIPQILKLAYNFKRIPKAQHLSLLKLFLDESIPKQTSTRITSIISKVPLLNMNSVLRRLSRVVKARKVDDSSENHKIIPTAHAEERRNSVEVNELCKVILSF